MSKTDSMLKAEHSKKSDTQVQNNPWQYLRQYTDARIALGRVGGSLPTQAHLAFQADHAKARDAVHLPLDYALLQKKLLTFGFPVMLLESCADTREVYLQRPDLGRHLSDNSIVLLKQHTETKKQVYDISITITEGLSSLAVTDNIENMLGSLLPELETLGLSVAPLSIVKQGRVAVADQVGFYLQAKMSVIFVGERPGLSSPDSLGIYFTFAPKPGYPDSKRNCLSNVRSRGMKCQQASERLIYLIQEANKRGYSGVNLKDETEVKRTLMGQNFLLPAKDKDMD
jgi:ethanolamine ammonia-lyase small subunit